MGIYSKHPTHFQKPTLVKKQTEVPEIWEVNVRSAHIVFVFWWKWICEVNFRGLVLSGSTNKRRWKHDWWQKFPAHSVIPTVSSIFRNTQFNNRDIACELMNWAWGIETERLKWSWIFFNKTEKIENLSVKFWIYNKLTRSVAPKKCLPCRIY